MYGGQYTQVLVPYIIYYDIVTSDLYTTTLGNFLCYTMDKGYTTSLLILHPTCNVTPTNEGGYMMLFHYVSRLDIYFGNTVILWGGNTFALNSNTTHSNI